MKCFRMQWIDVMEKTVEFLNYSLSLLSREFIPEISFVYED